MTVFSFLAKSVAAAVASVLLAGCAHHNQLSDADRNQFVTEFFAIVSNVRQVEFESHVGPAATEGAIYGALSGAQGDRGDILGGAIAGGLLYGLITAIWEGPNVGYEYQLDAVDGDSIAVVVDYDAAGIGDCVRVRVTGNVNIQRVSEDVCQEEQEYYEDSEY